METRVLCPRPGAGEDRAERVATAGLRPPELDGHLCPAPAPSGITTRPRPECHTSLWVLSSNTPSQGCVQHLLKVSAEHLQEWKGLPPPRLAARLQILVPSLGAQRDPEAVHPHQAVQAFGGQELVNNNCI